MKLTAPSIRTWDPPETRAVYWSGASHAVTRAMNCYGCKTTPIRPVLLEAAKAATEAYWAIGGIDALPDSVVEHHPGGLKALQNLRRSWIKTNHDLADAYAKRIGLMK